MIVAKWSMVIKIMKVSLSCGSKDLGRPKVSIPHGLLGAVQRKLTWLGKQPRAGLPNRNASPFLS